MVVEEGESSWINPILEVKQCFSPPLRKCSRYSLVERWFLILQSIQFCSFLGHLLLYKILTEDKASDLKINWAVMESYIPSLCLSVTSRPISRLAAYFRNRDIVVAVSDRDGKCSVISLLNINFTSEE